MEESNGCDFERTTIDLEVAERRDDGARLVVERCEDEPKSDM